MISHLQMELHDYDWFCIINGYPVCVSSAGSRIPDAISVKNYVLNSMYRAARLPRVCGFELNTAFLSNNIVTKGFAYLTDANSTYREMLQPKDITFPANTPLPVQYYSEYFAKIAERGFWVFDRDIKLEDCDRFHLVAWPEIPDAALTLKKKMFTDLQVELSTNALDFKNPEGLVEIKLLDFFVDANLQIGGQLMLEQ